jgi:hypothetical protein
MTRRRRDADDAAVTTRATAIAQRQETQYWLVADVTDLASLLFGIVTPAIGQQVVALLHREATEGDAEYGARLADLVVAHRTDAVK